MEKKRFYILPYHNSQPIRPIFYKETDYGNPGRVELLGPIVETVLSFLQKQSQNANLRLEQITLVPPTPKSPASPHPRNRP